MLVSSDRWDAMCVGLVFAKAIISERASDVSETFKKLMVEVAESNLEHQEPRVRSLVAEVRVQRYHEKKYMKTCRKGIFLCVSLGVEHDCTNEGLLVGATSMSDVLIFGSSNATVMEGAKFCVLIMNFEVFQAFSCL